MTDRGHQGPPSIKPVTNQVIYNNKGARRNHNTFSDVQSLRNAFKSEELLNYMGSHVKKTSVAADFTVVDSEKPAAARPDNAMATSTSHRGWEAIDDDDDDNGSNTRLSTSRQVIEDGNENDSDEENDGDSEDDIEHRGPQKISKYAIEDDTTMLFASDTTQGSNATSDMKINALSANSSWLFEQLNTAQLLTNVEYSDFEKQILQLLNSHTESETLENELASLFNFDGAELIQLLVLNRYIVLLGVTYSNLKSKHEKEAYIQRCRQDARFTSALLPFTAQESLLNANTGLSLSTSALSADDISSQHKNATKRMATNANHLEIIDLQRLAADLDRPPNYADLKLPINSQQIPGKDYTSLIIPAPKPNPTLRSDLIDMATLPEYARICFPGVRQLNKVQSTVYPATFESSQNVLICAPTGCGKTNCAMLAITREILKAIDTKSLNSTQIVYIAPMKALVTEVVGNLRSRFTEFNVLLEQAQLQELEDSKALASTNEASFTSTISPIRVQEVSGDISVSREILSSAHILVSTPEKWDVLTRRNLSESLYKNVKLVIIDEIHLLQDTRGPILESIIARGMMYSEQAHKHIRFLGLSATLANYLDVARFLRVQTVDDPARGLSKGVFFFDGSFRPCPLQMSYVTLNLGDSANSFASSYSQHKRGHKYQTQLNKACWEQFVQYLPHGQVLIFTHSRRDTFLTVEYLLAQIEADPHAFQTVLSQIQSRTKGQYLPLSQTTLREYQNKIENPSLSLCIQNGFGIHHGGLSRGDRDIVEELYMDQHLHTLVSTATLAWGVNLPAHSVIIKGTSVYSPEKGDYIHLTTQDAVQMLGRAGRPQFDEFGDGVIITTEDHMPIYLSAITTQVPVESQLVRTLCDILNAEIAIGNIRNLDDAFIWIQYSFFYIRALQNPTRYGVHAEDLAHIRKTDPHLQQHMKSLLHSALSELSKLQMIFYSLQTRFVSPKADGRTAAKFYLTYRSIALYTSKLSPFMSDSDILQVFALSYEFQHMGMRQEERSELESLYVIAPIAITTPIDDLSSKINLLLQSYISRAGLNGMALAADMVYITQSAGRIMRALYELLSSRNFGRAALTALDLCISIEHRVWAVQCPLRQFIPPHISLFRNDIPNQLQLGTLQADMGSDVSNTTASSFLNDLSESSAGDFDPSVLLLTSSTGRVNATDQSSLQQSPQLLKRNERLYKVLDNLCRAIENSQIEWSLFQTLNDDQIGQIVPRTKDAFDVIHCLPLFDIISSFQPISYTNSFSPVDVLLNLRLEFDPDFQWDIYNKDKNDDKSNNLVNITTITQNTLQFTLHIFSHDYYSSVYSLDFSVTHYSYSHQLPTNLSIQLPLTQPLPSAFYCVISSSQFHGCGQTHVVSLKNVLWPRPFKPLTIIPTSMPLLRIQHIPLFKIAIQYFTQQYGATFFGPVLSHITEQLLDKQQTNAGMVIAASQDATFFVNVIELTIFSMLWKQLIRQQQIAKAKAQRQQSKSSADDQNDQDDDDEDDDDDDIDLGCMMIVVGTSEQSQALYTYFQTTTQLFVTFQTPAHVLVGSTDIDIPALQDVKIAIGTVQQWEFLSRNATFCKKTFPRFQHIILSDIIMLSMKRPVMTNPFNDTRLYEVLIMRLNILSSSQQTSPRFIVVSSPLANSSDLAKMLPNISEIRAYDISVMEFERQITCCTLEPQVDLYLAQLQSATSAASGNDQQSNLRFLSRLQQRGKEQHFRHFSYFMQHFITHCSVGQSLCFLNSNERCWLLASFITQNFTRHNREIMSERFRTLRTFVQEELHGVINDTNHHNTQTSNDSMSDDVSPVKSDMFSNGIYSNDRTTTYHNPLLQAYLSHHYRTYSNLVHNAFSDDISEEEEDALLTLFIHATNEQLDQILPSISPAQHAFFALGIGVLYQGMPQHEFQLFVDLYKEGFITVLIVHQELSFALPPTTSASFVAILDDSTFVSSTQSYEVIQPALLVKMISFADPRNALNTVTVRSAVQNENSGDDNTTAQLSTPRELGEPIKRMYIAQNSRVAIYAPQTNLVLMKNCISSPYCVESLLTNTDHKPTNSSTAASSAAASVGSIISHLFISALGVEIASKRIHDASEALKYLSTSLLWQRSTSNPQHYHLTQTTQIYLREFFSSFIETNFRHLMREGCLDDLDPQNNIIPIAPTQLLAISNRFLLRPETVAFTDRLLDHQFSLSQLFYHTVAFPDTYSYVNIPPTYQIQLISRALHFTLFQQQYKISPPRNNNSNISSKNRTLTTLSDEQYLQSQLDKIPHTPTAHGFALLLLYFAQASLPPELKQQQSNLLHAILEFLHAYINIAQLKWLGHAVLACIEVIQSITQGSLPAPLYVQCHNTSQFYPLAISQQIDSFVKKSTQNNLAPSTPDAHNRLITTAYRSISSLKQIPHFTPSLALHCIENYKLVSILDFLDSDDKLKIMNDAKFSRQQMQDVVTYVNAFPVPELQFMIANKGIVVQDQPHKLIVKIFRNPVDDDDDEDDDDDDKDDDKYSVEPSTFDVPTHTPLPFSRRENWFVVLTAKDPKTKAITCVGMKRAIINPTSSIIDVMLQFSTDLPAGKHKLDLYVICDAYLDVREHETIDITVVEPQEDE